MTHFHYPNRAVLHRPANRPKPVWQRSVPAMTCAVLLAACQTLPKTGDPTLDSIGSTLAGGNPPVPSAQSGCKRLGATSDTTNAAIGAAAGAGIGLAAGSNRVRARNGALLGAVLGALAGSQFNRAIGVSEQPDGAVKLNIPGSVMFRSGSADISREFGATLNSVASTVREYCGLSATVVGHTDSVGSAEMNHRLSNERAQAVVVYLVRQGVPSDHLHAEGHGMNEPVASNATEAGRAQNRRVEMLVRPVSM